MSNSENIPETTVNSIGMEFVLIPPGSFKMGGDKTASRPRTMKILSIRSNSANPYR